jgi:hypothetical protein
MIFENIDVAIKKTLKTIVSAVVNLGKPFNRTHQVVLGTLIGTGS